MNARVCLYDLQVLRVTEDTMIYILHLYYIYQIAHFFAFLTSENDIIGNVMIRHLSLFWHIVVRFKELYIMNYTKRKELFPCWKGILSLKLLKIASEM